MDDRFQHLILAAGHKGRKTRQAGRPGRQEGQRLLGNPVLLPLCPNPGAAPD
jgi:hypothetical protein